MGSPKLWEWLTTVMLTMHELSLPSLGRDKCYILGIDISHWFYQAGAVHQYNHATRGKNPELLTIFRRFVRLLGMPVTVVLVFDGPGRPSEKRGKKITGVRHWLHQDVWELAEACKFRCHEAPGEAEAELAQLNARGIIDGVLTDDVDAVLFGAQTVIRTPDFSASNDDFIISVYHASPKSPSLGSILLFVLLSGGDYSSGLFGVGPALVQGLVQYDLGDRLLNATQTLPRPHLTVFLSTWRADLVSILEDDPLHELPPNRRQVTVPLDFPVLDVLIQYVKPLTSWSNYGEAPFERNSVILAQPDLSRIVTLCTRHFTWSMEDGSLMKTFHSTVWGPCFARLLYGDIFSGSAAEPDTCLDPRHSLKIHDSPEPEPSASRDHSQQDPRKSLKILGPPRNSTQPVLRISFSAVRFFFEVQSFHPTRVNSRPLQVARNRCKTRKSGKGKEKQQAALLDDEDCLEDVKIRLPISLLAQTHAAALNLFNNNKRSKPKKLVPASTSRSGIIALLDSVGLLDGDAFGPISSPIAVTSSPATSLTSPTASLTSPAASPTSPITSAPTLSAFPAVRATAHPPFTPTFATVPPFVMVNHGHHNDIIDLTLDEDDGSDLGIIYISD